MKGTLRLLAMATLLPATICVGASNQFIKIDVYGDSTTQGWTVEDGKAFRSDQNEPNFLQSILRHEYGDRISVANYGVPGAEALQILRGTGNRIRPWSVRMANSDAQIVILNFGQNDALYGNVVTPNIPAESPDDYARIMTQMIGIAKSAGKIVVLEEPNPSCMPTRVRFLPGYIAKLREVAKQQDVRLIPQFDDIQSLPGWKSLLPDCVHPAASLYRLKAQRSAEVIGPMIGDMLRQSR